MSEILIRIIIAMFYVLFLIIIAATIMVILKNTNDNRYIIGFLSLCCSHWLLGNIIKIIKKSNKEN